VIEVATLPLTILKSGKLAKGADALTDAATANKVTNAADAAADVNKAADAGDAAKAPEPQGPNGNGGKVAQQKKKPSYVIGQSDGGPGTWQKETTPTKGSEYQEKVTGAPKDTEYVVETDRMKSGKKKFDGYDPETNTLIDAKDWEAGSKGWPPEGQKWASDRVADIAKKDAMIARDVGSNLEYHVPSLEKANQLKEIFKAERIKGINIVVTPKG